MFLGATTYLLHEPFPSVRPWLFSNDKYGCYFFYDMFIIVDDKSLTDTISTDITSNGTVSDDDVPPRYLFFIC